MLALLSAPSAAYGSGRIRSEISRREMACGAAAAAAAGFIPSVSAAPVPGAIIYDTHLGQFMPADPKRYLGDALRQAAEGDVLPRVIFVGEEHPHRLHHTLQLEVIKMVEAIDEAPTLIGLEMCCCLLYTSPSPRDMRRSRMPSSA